MVVFDNNDSSPYETFHSQIIVPFALGARSKQCLSSALGSMESQMDFLAPLDCLRGRVQLNQ